MESLKLALAIDMLLFLIALVLILRSPLVENGRKILQVLFSLLIPYVGPILTIIVHLSDRTKPGIVSDRYFGQSIDETPWDVKLYYMTHPEDR